MATPETQVKQKLGRRDKKIADKANLLYRRLTFGPYGTSGTPDQLKSWGTASVYVEVKRQGKKPTKLQALKIDEAIKHGTPAMYVAGEEGEHSLETYYEELAKWFTAEAVEDRIDQYRRDCAMLHQTLVELRDE